MQIFLSHASSDESVARVLKKLIERCSLGQLSVWFSSDLTPTGGVTPGGPWFDQLMKAIKESSTFLALVTPNSIDNLWMHYETGCAATLDVPIVPVLAGVTSDDLRKPIELYHYYALSRKDQLMGFLTWLFTDRGVKYHKAMLETPVQDAVREIHSFAASSLSEDATLEAGGSDRLERLIDRRFMDLFERLPKTYEKNLDAPVFTMQAQVLLNNTAVSKVKVDIGPGLTLQNFADDLYFQLSDYVEPYTYLEKWIVRDKTAGVHLVIRECMEIVAADAIIKPGHEYEIILLSAPYRVSDMSNFGPQY